MNSSVKKLTTILIYLIIITITLEVTPFILSSFIMGHSFSRSNIHNELAQSIVLNVVSKDDQSSSEQSEYLGDHILHPYLGFVSIPHDTYNEFCLPGINPLTKKSPDCLNVVIMGGSVAKDLYSYSGDRIKQKLKESERYRNKKINLVVFALGGFKQPQQLLALNYFMALGAEYDLVINLDGFNEIVLPYSDNLPFHVFPSYPRHWNIYARKKLDTKVVLLMGKQAVVKEKQNNCKIHLAQSISRYSNFRLFLWKISDNKKINEIAALEAKIRSAIENSEADYQATGIYTSISDTTSFFEDQAVFWRKSSEQIAHLSKSADFNYYHFLQPNQYVENSKKLTKEELEIAFESGPFAYKDAAQKGYPLLIEEGKKMIGNDVIFVDLTMLFKNENRTIYNDKCCHYNQIGYDLIADKITNTIISP
ncbi:MAG: hypothetical protein K8R74_07640 [Bacteroidales bacterium]|nr:hypothetical protein [Bacteroidales bacterium]